MWRCSANDAESICRLVTPSSLFVMLTQAQLLLLEAHSRIHASILYIYQLLVIIE